MHIASASLIRIDGAPLEATAAAVAEHNRHIYEVFNAFVRSLISLYMHHESVPRFNIIWFDCYRTQPTLFRRVCVC